MTANLLNGEMWYSIGAFLGLSDVFTLLSLSKSINSFFMENYFWQEYLLATLFKDVHDVTMRVENSRELLMLLKKAIVSNRFYNLAVDICDASSVDRIVERPDNILTESKCYLSFRKNNKNHPNTSKISASLFHNLNDFGSFVQRKCCVMNDPCYWSSAPSKDASNHEHITIELVSSVSVVVGFTVTPYQAFFHPDAPTYAPKEVCIQFLHPSTTTTTTATTTIDAKDSTQEVSSSNGISYRSSSSSSYYSSSSSSSSSNGKNKAKSMAELKEGVYFESAYYPVQKSFDQQVFYFDRPQLCFTGTVRIVFKGFSQRQTLDFTSGQDYYICISYASILGLPLLSHTTDPVEIQPHYTSGPVTGIINTDASCSKAVDDSHLFNVLKDAPKNLVTLYDKYPDVGATSLIQRIHEVYDDSHIQALLGDRSKVVTIKEHLYSFMDYTTPSDVPPGADHRKAESSSQENCSVF